MRSHFASAGPRIRRVQVVDLVADVLDYLFGLLYALLLIRFVLELLDARPRAGFVHFIRGLTEPFYAPFQGIVATSSMGGLHIVWSLIVAIVGYSLLHTALRGLLRLLARD